MQKKLAFYKSIKSRPLNIKYFRIGTAFLSVSFLLHNKRNLPHINHQLCTGMDATYSPTGQNKSIAC